MTTSAYSQESDLTNIGKMIVVVAGLGIIFQVGHFAEHALQFLVWLTGNFQWVVSAFCGRDTPFMSGGVMSVVSAAGAFLFPNADLARQMMMGVEILHLIGNTIFLVSIGCLYFVVKSKWVRYAFYIEGFHLLEHLLLTVTALYLGKPLGLSTLFGYAPMVWGGKEGAVGYRVSWHFVMNLAPLPFVMFALMHEWSRLKALMMRPTAA